MNKEKKITVVGDSIGKGVFTDGGKIEVIKDNAVRLFEDWKGVEIDNRSGYGQSLKRLLDKGVIEKYIAGLDQSMRNIAVIELGGNDADFDWKAVADAPNDNHYPKNATHDLLATKTPLFSTTFGADGFVRPPTTGDAALS